MSAEADFQYDLLKRCYSEGRKHDGTYYQKRLFVLSKVSIMEQQYRSSKQYTFAMYCRHLRTMLDGEPYIHTVLERFERGGVQPPHSNTGVNPPVSLPMTGEEAVSYGL